MQKRLLLLVYDSILVSILSEWIKSEDVCYLDTAVCCHTIRTNFLRVLRLTSVVVRSDLLPKAKRWLLLREMGLMTYNLDQPLNQKEAKLLLKKKNLYCVESSNCIEMITFLEQAAVTANKVKLELQFIDIVRLSSIGHRINDISLLYLNLKFLILIAKACPILKSVTLSYGKMEPFVTHCQHLDTLYKCCFISPLDGEPFCCDMKRTSIVDESAVCLAEGKYFNITGLYLRNDVSQENTTVLAPLLKPLKRLQMDEHTSMVRAAIAAKCNLTYIFFDKGWVARQYWTTLLKQSPALKELVLVFDGRSTADYYLGVVAEYCPLLESCTLSNVTVEEGYTLRNLFKRTNLTVLNGSHRFANPTKSRRKLRSLLFKPWVWKDIFFDESVQMK